MSSSDDLSIDLLGRPEPHYPEGRRWPHPGWRGWVLSLMLAVLTAAAIGAACWTEMLVTVQLSGSVISKRAGPGEPFQVVLFGDAETGKCLEVGQPVRLRVTDATGWGVLVKITDTQADSETSFVKGVVAAFGPPALILTVPGQSCEGHVLVGFTPIIRGLWQLATNQAPRPSRGRPAELRQRIPSEWRDMPVFRRIEQNLPGGRDPTVKAGD